MTENNWLVIVNPTAGGSKAKDDWPYIKELLAKQGLQHDTEFTTRKLHAMVITRNKILQGYHKIIVVGGDGTMNEVINGVFAQDKVPTDEIMLGLITVGTGNDWGKMFNIPSDYEAAIETILNQRTFIQDAGLVTYRRKDQVWNRYFINIAGMGFGAKVVAKTNKLKARGKSNPRIYMLNIFTSLLKYKSIQASISIDGDSFRRKLFSMNVGIGKYNGGGMMQVPDAIADDGLYSITLIKKMGRIRVIASMKKLYNGKIGEHKRVESYTGKKIMIDSPKQLQLETDGETLGHSPIEFEIIPRSVKVIANGISA